MTSNSSMSVDELQEVRNIWDELNLVFSDGRIVTLNEQQEREYRAFIHQYVTKKQIEARKEDWLWFADALMDRRIGADAALREFEKQLESKEER